MNSRENNEMSIVFKNKTLYDSERRFWQKYSSLLTVEGLKRLWTQKTKHNNFLNVKRIIDAIIFEPSMDISLSEWTVNIGNDIVIFQLYWLMNL
jgi:hypothetical protein